jgi:hypothetical protein
MRLSGGVDADDVLNEVQITQGVYYGRREVVKHREVTQVLRAQFIRVALK